MSNEQPRPLDLFIHRLAGPLTTLHGTARLLRRRLEHSSDPEVAELLAALDRSVSRLKAVGELLISRAEGQGQTVSILLPSAELRQLAQAPAPEPAAPAVGDERAPREDKGPILIIGQEAGLPGQLGAALRTAGHEVLVATGSTSGLDLARTSRPRMIVLDPQVDAHGSVILSLLAEDPDTKATRLVVVQAATAPGALATGMTGIAAGASLGDALALVEDQLQAIGADGRPRPRLLVVDDEVEIARFIAAELSSQGYEVDVVNSGTAALQLPRERQYDLILLDLLMPDIDGFTVLGGLRARQETQLTPIILLSAVNSPAEKVRGFQLGADDYITKPFSLDELSARIHATKRRSEREGGANPSTRLPGNLTIERTISQRIDLGEPFVVCYADLDNFKAYNDTYSFLKGDAVIQRTAQILLDVVRDYGNPDDFVGHIGGDDFVVISTPERAEAICQAAIARFAQIAPLFYDPETRTRGTIQGLDRHGRTTVFPLVSLSIGAVSSTMRPFTHPGDVAQRSVEPKRLAKFRGGGTFVLSQ